MQIFGKYSFNGGEEYINSKYPNLLTEVESVINKVDAKSCKTKENQ